MIKNSLLNKSIVVDPAERHRSMDLFIVNDNPSTARALEDNVTPALGLLHGLPFISIVMMHFEILVFFRRRRARTSTHYKVGLPTSTRNVAFRLGGKG